MLDVTSITNKYNTTYFKCTKIIDNLIKFNSMNTTSEIHNNKNEYNNISE